ncbi:MAG: DUF1501 domain-containing protein [Phycisphaerales bacterium]|nr:DUF1501 domain-containing protein [Phycisphaerales bacterium]
MHQPDAYSRRIFIRQGVMLASFAATLPHFIQESALGMLAPDGSATGSRPGVPDERILVIVQLSGGNDGLNTVIPYGDREYHAARPSLSLGEPGKAKNGGAALELDRDRGIGLHPNLTGLKELHDDGRLAVVAGVGYPNPNRSHFASMDIWQSGRPEGKGTGWLGRYVDATCNGNPAADVAVSVGRTAPLAMLGRTSRPIAFESADLFRWLGADAGGQMDAEYQRMVRAGELKDVAAGSQESFLMRTALDAQVTSDRIRAAVKKAPLARYPGSAVAKQLQTVAAMIRDGMKTRVYYVSMGGFDTHANQPNSHGNLMRQLGDAMLAFQNDLKAQGNDGRVMTMCFSEFGRRVRQNASNGTDHGTAGPVFVVGPNVNPGLQGKYPSLTDLDGGDLKFTTDFRGVYQELLGKWMKAPTREVLGGTYQAPSIVRA